MPGIWAGACERSPEVDLGLLMETPLNQRGGGPVNGSSFGHSPGVPRPGQARHWGVCSPRGRGALGDRAEECFTLEDHLWGPVTPVAPFCRRLYGRLNLMATPRGATCCESFLRLSHLDAQPRTASPHFSHLATIIKTIPRSHVLGGGGGCTARPHQETHRLLSEPQG